MAEENFCVVKRHLSSFLATGGQPHRVGGASGVFPPRAGREWCYGDRSPRNGESRNSAILSIRRQLRLSMFRDGEEGVAAGVAAGLSAMEDEFLQIDENGRWSAVYQVGPLPKF